MLSNNQLPEDQKHAENAAFEDSKNQEVTQIPQTTETSPEEPLSQNEETDPSGNNEENGRKDFPQEELLEKNDEKSYTFRWSYADQSAFDQSIKKKAKKGRVLTFVLVMFLAFASCFALLFGVLLWHGPAEDPIGDSSFPNASLSGVVDSILPSTVMVETVKSDGLGYGTGFFVRSNGYIATNYHVIDGADAVHVALYSGEKVTAEVIGYSIADDIAVLKIAGSNFPVLAVGDSDALKMGDTLVAVGHPGGPDGAWSTTSGIVSALSRQLTVTGEGEIYEVTMLQTDTALNHGNSGGPICNANGEVVGIVTRKLIDKEGMSYALPINGSMEIVNTIIRDGHGNNVVSTITKIRPSIGIQCYDIVKGETYTYAQKTYTAQQNGVWVEAIEAGSGADGVLQYGDIVVALDGATVGGMNDLKTLLYNYRSGDTAEVTVIRGETRINVTITLGKV